MTKNMHDMTENRQIQQNWHTMSKTKHNKKSCAPFVTTTTAIHNETTNA